MERRDACGTSSTACPYTENDLGAGSVIAGDADRTTLTRAGSVVHIRVCNITRYGGRAVVHPGRRHAPGAWRRRPASPMGFADLDPQQIRSQQVFPRQHGSESARQPARRIRGLIEMASPAALQIPDPPLRPERPARRGAGRGLAADGNQKDGVRRYAGIGNRKMRVVPGYEARPRGLEVLSQIGSDPCVVHFGDAIIRAGSLLAKTCSIAATGKERLPS